MKLKLRFALLFTLFVAIILLISSVTIYVLYRDYRTDDYFKRLRIEGQKLFDEYAELRLNNKEHDLKKLDELHKNTLNNEVIIICDSAKHILLKT